MSRTQSGEPSPGPATGEPIIIVLLGGPGAGKGTQAKRLTEELGLIHISSGDLFRENLGQGTELGKLADEYMSKGLLVPDDVTIRMVFDRMSQPDVRASAGVVLDGFPRTRAQAEALDKALAERGRQVTRAVYVVVRDEELAARLEGRRICPQCQTTYHLRDMPPKVANVCDNDGTALIQREDDQPETVARRLREYHENTEPLIGYYRERGVLAEVNGEQEVDEVMRDAVAAIHLGRLP